MATADGGGNTGEMDGKRQQDFRALQAAMMEKMDTQAKEAREERQLGKKMVDVTEELQGELAVVREEIAMMKKMAAVKTEATTGAVAERRAAEDLHSYGLRPGSPAFLPPH
ncbi:hypothetical protein E2C01_089704 [Portunus trituberculatus]|uniref:Uncharacterized protein n=1 Tax=Portunus trituberculatus TaxID=210409 RepID=A0A5B7J9I7_PORTR|nr:hypothetical protein [Portunus trituberculatus]